MDAANRIREAISRLGGETLLRKDGKEYRFFACIQPESYNTLGAGSPRRARTGLCDPRRFCYYGPLEGGGGLAAEGDAVEQGGRRFRLLLCHDFCWRGRPVYRWAAAEEEDMDNGDV